MPPTDRALHAALIEALTPITRWRHPYPADGKPVLVNQVGVDVWENHVGDVRLDLDGPGGTPGTAHAYLFVQTGPGSYIQPRAVTTATYTTWRPIVTVAAGTPVKAMWALDKVRPLLDGLTLTDPSGRELTAPLHEGFDRRETYDPGPLRLDEDPSPPRWYVPIQYATTAH